MTAFQRFEVASCYLAIAATMLTCACNNPITAALDAAPNAPDQRSPDQRSPDAAPSPPRTTEWVVLARGGNSRATSVAFDSADNVYVAGSYSGIMRIGNTALVSGYKGAIFIAKFSSGGKVLWIRSVGGMWGDDSVDELRVDSAGNVYVSGYFTGVVQFGSIYLKSPRHGLFLARLRPDGKFTWARTLTTDKAFLAGLALDSKGNPHVAGNFDAPAQIGGTTLASKGEDNSFVAQFDGTTGKVQWVTTVGGSGSTVRCEDLSMDSKDNPIVAGLFTGKVAFGSTMVTSSGHFVDLFVAKLDPKGVYRWALSGASPGSSSCVDIFLDSTDNSYAIGSFAEALSLGTVTLKSKGVEDIVARIGPKGSVHWVMPLIGNASYYGMNGGLNAGAATSSGNAVVAGYYVSPISLGSLKLSPMGDTSMFVAEMDASGRFRWATTAGGPGNETGPYAIAVDSSGHIHVVGMTTHGATAALTFGGLKLPPGIVDTSYTKTRHAFLWKLRQVKP